MKGILMIRFIHSLLQLWQTYKYFLGKGSGWILDSVIDQTAQPTYNIPRLFPEGSLSVETFQISRKLLGNMIKKNIFWKIIDGKVVFVLKVYDLTITNVDLLGNCSNHKAMFPEYSKKIPRISISKIFQGNENAFMKSKSS